MAIALTAWIAVSVLGYTYVGYPLLVTLLGRFRNKRSRRDAGFEPRVTVLIAVHNAESFIVNKLDSVFHQEYPADKLDVLVCSDGSTDKTNHILAEYAEREPRLRVLYVKERSGKPNAINLMRPEATGDVLLMTDIRQPLSRLAVKHLVAELADPEVGCATGILALEGETGAGLYWRYEAAIRRGESRFRSLVGVTGALYALRKEHLGELPKHIVLDDMWVPMRIRLQGLRVVMVGAAIAYDQAFEDSREFSRKVRTLAGNYQLFAMMPALLIPFVNPSWFETMSHKVFRLLCPWALIALLAATALLARDNIYAQTFLTLQGLFYLAALIGPRAGKIPGIARTFVVLNAAAIFGLFRFLKSPGRIAW
jgi:cellulose synthase/poly-beta-1,6-N-acetylglucosamine synthase-like glycosyltransferase